MSHNKQKILEAYIKKPLPKEGLDVESKLAQLGEVEV